MRHEMFDGKIPNLQKLKAYGFEEVGDALTYSVKIMDGQFSLTVVIVGNEVTTSVTDLASSELYTLHMIDGAAGAFVGAVRAEVAKALSDIAEACFDKGAFKGATAQKVLRFAKENFGNELEFLWEGFPKDAVLRRKDSGKWYALFVELDRAKLGVAGDGEVDIAVMRALPDSIPTLTDGISILPAYHMNKKNWLTAVLDDTAESQKICQMLRQSYDLAK